MADLAGRPLVEQVLAVRLDPFEHGAVDALGSGGEPSLRARHAYGSAREEPTVVPSDAMDGVALRHDGRERTMTGPWSSHRAPNVLGLSVLGLDAELAATCVSCGLCLPHCPTFRVTGEEKYSPRGRIDAMRAVDRGELPIDDDFVDFVETCVQCRGCETACPSGVQFGTLMEETRTALATDGRITPWWQRIGFRVLRHHRLLLVGSTAIAVGQRLRLVPKRFGVPPLAAAPRAEGRVDRR